MKTNHNPRQLAKVVSDRANGMLARLPRQSRCTFRQ